MAGETAVFPIKVEADAGPARAMADAMAELDARIAKGESSVKSMSVSLRRLRGATEEVKAGKISLKDRIDDEKTALDSVRKARADLAARVEKQRVTAEKAQKAEIARQDALSAAISKGGGPLGDLNDKVEGLSSLASGAAGPIGLLVAASVALVAIVTKATSALIEGAIALGRWIIESADAARSAALLREAMTGSAQQGAALTSQVNALASKIPTPKEKIDDLAKSLYKAGLGGQTLVDSLHAIGRSGAAGGDELASLERSIVSRGVLPNGGEGRFQVTLQELRELKSQGLDLAGSFARSTGQTVQAATAQLLSGRIPLKRGAAALRKAAEDGFGAINAKQMRSLPVIFSKIRENLAGMTRDVNLEPLLEGLGKIGRFFDENTVPGRALKGLITDIGNGIASLGGKTAPTVLQWLERLELSALVLELYILKVRAAWIDFSNAVGSQNIDKAVSLLADFSGHALLAATGLQAIVSSATILASVVGGASAAIDRLTQVISTARNVMRSLDWAEVGKQIVQGIVSGIESSVSSLVTAMKSLADRVKNAFALKLQISSPSKVFERYGENTGEGYAIGVRRSAGDVGDAARELAPSAPRGGAAAFAAGATRVTHEFHFHVASEEAARVMRQDAGFLAQLTRAVEGLNVISGLPVQSEAA